MRHLVNAYEVEAGTV